MISIDDHIVPRIQAEAQNCPIPDIRAAFMRAFTELCRRSKAWRRKLDAYGFKGVDVIDIDIPSDVRVMDVLHIEQILPFRDILVKDRDYEIVSQYRDDENELSVRLRHVPTMERQPYSCVCALCPTDELEEIPDMVWNRFRNTLRSGTLYEIKSMSGREYCDPQGAGYHLDIYERGIWAASGDAGRAYAVSPAKMKPHFI